jgi:hypothetical protein
MVRQHFGSSAAFDRLVAIVTGDAAGIGDAAR